MKLYLSTKEINKKSIVGLVLLNDEDEIYTKGSFVCKTTIPPSAYILGLKKALLYLKNNKPIKAKTDLEVFTDSKNNYFFHPAVQRNMNHDIFFSKVQRRIIFKDAGFNDSYYLTICRNEIRFNNMENNNVTNSYEY